jgi:ribosomal protein S17
MSWEGIKHQGRKGGIVSDDMDKSQILLNDRYQKHSKMTRDFSTLGMVPLCTNEMAINILTHSDLRT